MESKRWNGQKERESLVEKDHEGIPKRIWERKKATPTMTAKGTCEIGGRGPGMPDNTVNLEVVTTQHTETQHELYAGLMMTER